MCLPSMTEGSVDVCAKHVNPTWQSPHSWASLPTLTFCLYHLHFCHSSVLIASSVAACWCLVPQLWLCADQQQLLQCAGLSLSGGGKVSAL